MCVCGSVSHHCTQWKKKCSSSGTLLASISVSNEQGSMLAFYLFLSAKPRTGGKALIRLICCVVRAAASCSKTVREIDNGH